MSLQTTLVVSSLASRFGLGLAKGAALPVGLHGFSTNRDEESPNKGSIGSSEIVTRHVYGQRTGPLGLTSGTGSLLMARKSTPMAMPWAAQQTMSMASVPQVQSGALSSSLLLGIYRFWRSQAPFDKPHAHVDSRMLPAIVEAHSQRASIGTWCSTLFLTIITCNLLGLVPFNEAPTSGLGFATGLGVTVWATATVLGFSKLGFTFPGHFIPSGTPWPMAFIFVPLETISYTFRAVSLGVRLWVNMLAGHTLLHILTGMSLALPFSLPFYSSVPATFAVCCLLSALVGLEYLVAVLQSGVFAILSSVYVGEFNSAKLAAPLAKIVKKAAH